LNSWSVLEDGLILDADLLIVNRFAIVKFTSIRFEPPLSPGGVGETATIGGTGTTDGDSGITHTEEQSEQPVP
jgi:hypothetical protein